MDRKSLRVPSTRTHHATTLLAVAALCIVVLVPALAQAQFVVTANKVSPVSGAVVLTASGYNAANIAGIQFVIDGLTQPGRPVFANRRIPPWYGYKLNAEVTSGLSGGSVTTTWAASIESNGTHAIAAVARYSDGTLIVSSDLTAIVSNPDFYNRQLYVDRSIGSDSNDGLAPAVGGGHGPWRSPARAISQAVAGDTIYLNGNFNGGDGAGDVLDLTNRAGTAAKPIRITATDQSNIPTFTVGLAGSGKMLYNDFGGQTSATQYIIVDHIHFSSTGQAGFDPPIELLAMNHVALRAITVDGSSSPSADGLRWRGTGCADNILDGSTFGKTGIGSNTGDGVMLNYGCLRNRVINNTVGDFGHIGINLGYQGYGGEPGPSAPCSYNVVAFNTVTNTVARAAGMVQVGDNNLWEYNTFQKSMSKSVISWPVNSPDLFGFNASYNTVRFNLLINAGGGGQDSQQAFLISSYVYNFNQVSKFNEIYHNTIYNNHGQAFNFENNNGLLSTNNKIWNNIFFTNSGVNSANPAGITPQTNAFFFNNTVDWTTGTYGFNEVRNNIFLRQPASAGEVIAIKEKTASQGGYWEFENGVGQMQSSFSAYWSGNLELDPKLVNPVGGDFHVQSISPTILAGKGIPGYPISGVAPTIGAYEFGGVSLIPSAPNSITLR